jgi:hypothetical protein
MVKNCQFFLIVLLINLVLYGCNFSRDHNDAETVADLVHAHIRAGNYTAIYNASAPRFKKVGNESGGFRGSGMTIDLSSRVL